VSALGKKLLLKPGMKANDLAALPRVRTRLGAGAGVRLVSLDGTWSGMMFRQR